jgi:CIC family chloride channel protein
MPSPAESLRPSPSAAQRLRERRSTLLRRLRAAFRVRRLYLLSLAVRWAPSEGQRLFLLTLLVGVLCGLAALAFHVAIGFSERHLIERALSASGKSWVAWTVAVPTIGGLVCGALLEFVVPNARGSGIPQVKVAFASRGGEVRARDAVGKFLVGSLQLGSGASLGREGSTVQICAGISSWLGRAVGLSAEGRRRLLPVGVAAGIAAAFNAPIAAVTFTIEEVVGRLDQTLLSGVIVAAAFAAVIERSVLGESPAFDLVHDYGLEHASSLLVYALLGFAAAGVSVFFTESLLRARARFRGMTAVPRWARPAIGGAVTGALAVVAVLALRTPGLTGCGYATLGQALLGELEVEVLLGLTVLKLAATVFSYASGGAGGIFAPTLFIGGMLGGAVGSLDQLLLGHRGVSLGAYALVGMGAVFAGTIRAPITSILIIVEMTRGYDLILPLMIANMTSYVIARRVRPVQIYEALLAQDGVEVPSPQAEALRESLPIASLLPKLPRFTSFPPNLRAPAVLELARRAREQHVFPVVTSERRLLGVVTSEEISLLESEPELGDVANALDLMREPVFVRAEDDLRSALEVMLHHGIREVPVVDDDKRLVSLLDEKSVARAYVRKAP